MEFLFGQSHEAFAMLHGGAGPMDPSREGVQKATESLIRIAAGTFRHGHHHGPAESLVASLLEGLENDPGFNAGYGAALQADGQVRLSAAYMDGNLQRFSGVISISDLRHPSKLAIALQHESSRVLTDPGHTYLARTLQLPRENLVTERRFHAWLEKRREAGFDSDTVGVVLSSTDRSLIAATSTGGRGFEQPGRVSDSATVAGNYASRFAAVSLTGIGEQIVDDGVAVRIETRVRDGWSLEKSCRRAFDEAREFKRDYGWIACDAKGHWCVAYTTAAMSYLVQTFEGAILASSAATKS